MSAGPTPLRAASRTGSTIPGTCFPFGIGEPPRGPLPVEAPVEAPGEVAAQRMSGIASADGIRRLEPADAEPWRALRLEALERHPEAYGASLQEERALSPEAWRARLERALVFGLWSGPALCGCAGLFVEQTQKKRHKAVLWGVYVRAEARGRGLGRALVGRAIDAARTQARQLHTAVVIDNLAARRLYRRLGFVAYGIEPRALEVAGRYLDEELLVLDLDRCASGAVEGGAP
ncbi:MAG TPA: GNAT family N-acetyltransferase [Geminicoccaceae bacterium]